MVECPVCLYHYSSARSHCPTCGTFYSAGNHIMHYENRNGSYTYRAIPIAVANGAERARQLPQSPIRFELVD